MGNVVFAIDTSSLLSLVRYYYAFDKGKILDDFIKERIKTGEIVVLDKVYEECRWVAAGLVNNKFGHVEGNNKKKFLDRYKTTQDSTWARQYRRLLENQWCVHRTKNEMDEQSFEDETEEFMKDADCHLLIYAIRNSNVCIVTEESTSPNDKKLFKKLPTICKDHHEPIECIKLPEMLDRFNFSTGYEIG